MSGIKRAWEKCKASTRIWETLKRFWRATSVARLTFSSSAPKKAYWAAAWMLLWPSRVQTSSRRGPTSCTKSTRPMKKTLAAQTTCLLCFRRNSLSKYISVACVNPHTASCPPDTTQNAGRRCEHATQDKSGKSRDEKPIITLGSPPICCGIYPLRGNCLTCSRPSDALRDPRTRDTRGNVGPEFLRHVPS